MKQRIEDLDLKGKKVFLRVDFNVPLEKGVIKNDTRIRRTLKTINHIIDNKAKLIIASHLGRPGGKIVEELSLKPISLRLAEILKRDVIFVGEVTGKKVDLAKKNLKKGQILMLENTRFESGEKKNSSGLSKKLAKNIDIYINDAFGACHREHSSVVGIAKYVKESAVGFLIDEEIKYLSMATEKQEKPYVTILGGAKVKSKIPVIENLLDKVDYILIGGGMAYTFLKAKGNKIGNSLFEEELFDRTKEILQKAEEKNVNLFLPEDHIAVEKIEKDAETVYFKEDISDSFMGVDIGENTRNKFVNIIEKANFLVWNGPMGVFEIDEFCDGTRAISNAISKSSAVSIVGGGDTVSALSEIDIEAKITHISTGGGASLKYLAGEKLPGIECIKNKE